MEQIIVLKELLCRVVRFHALRTDEALKHKSPSLESVGEEKTEYKSLKKPKIPLRFDRGSVLRWAAPILHSGSPPSQGSWKKK